MRFTVVGAGAIGGTVAAYLARAGEPVEVVDSDARHVAAIRERGLGLRGFRESFTVRLEANTPSALSGPQDVVLLAVKAQHTAAALMPIVPLLSPSSMVVSLQNGLCEPVIAELVGRRRTIAAFVNFFADYLEPGVIHYGGEGSFVVGELDGPITTRVRELAHRLSVIMPVRPSSNVSGYLWAKLGFGSMLFATAVVDAPMADVIDAHRLLMADLAAEVYEVASLEDVRLESFEYVDPGAIHPRHRRDPDRLRGSFEHMVASLRGKEKTRSGVWRDLAVRRRKTEVDQQIGAVLDIGARHRLRLPLNRRLMEIVHELEDGTREMGPENLIELEQVDARAYGGASSSLHTC